MLLPDWAKDPEWQKSFFHRMLLEAAPRKMKGRKVRMRRTDADAGLYTVTIQGIGTFHNVSYKAQRPPWAPVEREPLKRGRLMWYNRLLDASYPIRNVGILQRFLIGEPNHLIAKDFGLSQSQVSRIILRFVALRDGNGDGSPGEGASWWRLRK